VRKPAAVSGLFTKDVNPGLTILLPNESQLGDYHSIDDSDF